MISKCWLQIPTDGQKCVCVCVSHPPLTRQQYFSLCFPRWPSAAAVGGDVWRLQCGAPLPHIRARCWPSERCQNSQTVSCPLSQGSDNTERTWHVRALRDSSGRSKSTKTTAVNVLLLLCDMNQCWSSIWLLVLLRVELVWAIFLYSYVI